MLSVNQVNGEYFEFVNVDIRICHRMFHLSYIRQVCSYHKLTIFTLDADEKWQPKIAKNKQTKNVIKQITKKNRQSVCKIYTL